MAEFSAPTTLKRKHDEESKSVYKRHFAELAEQGYTVIEGVVPEQVCADSFSGIMRFLNEAGVNTADPHLAMASYPNSHGIVQHLEAGQMQPVWDIRLREEVSAVFEDLYGDNDLLVSFDGFCWMPRHLRHNGRQWMHADQSHKRLGLRCIQGYVNLLPSHDERSGSLVVVPGSHRKHAEYAAQNPESTKNPKDWHKYTDAELAAFGETVRVHGRVGSLVLWDSRTAHSARPPEQDADETRERCVVYVCYQPRALIAPAALKRKVKAFDEFRMTTHWPASRIEQFPKTWRTWGKPITVRTPARTRRETPRMLELAGKTPLTTRRRETWTPALKFTKD